MSDIISVEDSYDSEDSDSSEERDPILQKMKEELLSSKKKVISYF